MVSGDFGQTKLSYSTFATMDGAGRIAANNSIACAATVQFVEFAMSIEAINLADKLSQFSEQWSPKVVAQMDGFQFRLAKLEGDFVWHSHADTDEAFLVIAGELRIDFRSHAVTLKAGELLVVPKGVEHKPFAVGECHVLVLVKAGTVNTGEREPDHRTSNPDSWI